MATFQDLIDQLVAARTPTEQKVPTNYAPLELTEEDIAKTHALLDGIIINPSVLNEVMREDPALFPKHVKRALKHRAHPKNEDRTLQAVKRDLEAMKTEVSQLKREAEKFPMDNRSTKDPSEVLSNLSDVQGKLTRHIQEFCCMYEKEIAQWVKHTSSEADSTGQQLGHSVEKAYKNFTVLQSFLRDLENVRASHKGIFNSPATNNIEASRETVRRLEEMESILMRSKELL
ncbi:uncharacterized protein VTP21DRAFT_1737 [Calcarisporiella thermophila]|uniref:uncharacterized protein n=1 Tax=Calcarisporiella thermophila TaxID=911321 RepID=UPI003743627F